MYKLICYDKQIDKLLGGIYENLEDLVARIYNYINRQINNDIDSDKEMSQIKEQIEKIFQNNFIELLFEGIGKIRIEQYK